MGQQLQGPLILAGGGVRPARGNVPPRNCFRCGQPCHWASQCTMKGPKGRMQMVGHNSLRVSQKGVAFDMQGPPPSACRHCGGGHWEQFCPIPQQQQAAGGVHGRVKSSTLPHPPGGNGPLTPLPFPLHAEHSGSARNCLAWPDRARGGFVIPMHDTPPCCTACRKVPCLPTARMGS